jgi:demethoxyubiquinone hydroxylase (CLK1/Coq7/Cat5 family)
MPEWLTILIAVGSGLAGGGAAWGVLTTRVGRLEKDIDTRASIERVDGVERLVEAHHDGIEKKLDKLEDLIELLRADIHRLRGDTNPGERR